MQNMFYSDEHQLNIGSKHNIKLTTSIKKSHLNSPRSLISSRNSNDPSKKIQLIKILKQQQQKNKQLKHKLHKKSHHNTKNEMYSNKNTFTSSQFQSQQQTSIDLDLVLDKINILLDQNTKLQNELKRQQTAVQVQKQIDQMVLQKIKKQFKYEHNTADVMNIWAQIKNLWGNKNVYVKENTMPRCSSNFDTTCQRLQSMIQDLNKKVVITKSKVQKLTKTQKTSQQDHEWFQTIMFQKLRKQILDNKLIQEEKQKKIIQHYEKQISKYCQDIKQLKNVLNQRNLEIQNLKNTVKKLEDIISGKVQNKGLENLAVPTYKIADQQEKKCQIKLSNFDKKINKKAITLDIEKIENDYQQKSTQSISIPTIQNKIKSQLTATINQNNQISQVKLSPDDPSFKSSCLSPTMLKMKYIQKMEIQRRQKFRQLRKDVIGSKTLLNEVQNLAAGVNTPNSLQMLQNAQNPFKNKFIRKPMSPIYGVIYKSPKNEEQKQLNQEPLNQVQKQAETQSNQMNQPFTQPSPKTQQKLNLPYFLSKKKKQ